MSESLYSTPSSYGYEENYLFALSETEPKDPEDIPSYQQAIQRERAKHIFTSKSLAKGSSISLELSSMSPSPDSTPVFSEGAIIGGRVLLDFKKRIGVKEITITIRGQATSILGSLQPVQVDMNFLDIKHVLWSSSTAASSVPSSPSSSYSSSYPPPSVDFRLPLPTSISYAGKQYSLPPTYKGKAHIDYIVLIVVKRDYLHSDISLRVPFRYISRVAPRPFHQLVMNNSWHFPGPQVSIDPIEWHVSTFSVPGRIRNGQPRWFSVRFITPQPTQYSAGGKIPFRLLVSGPLEQPSNLIPPSMVQWDVHLVQHRTFQLVATAHKLNATISPSNNPVSSGVDVLSTTKLRAATTGLPFSEMGSVPDTILDGELYIPMDIVPTFEFPLLNVEYRIRLVPKMKDSQMIDSPLLETPILVVATLY
ncbi:hypothetical protein DL93DRAFT_2155363 [Clavulina sp. PMI_390]|nr:hypothetical protein DL93DRAFT_2155363 [Clavulina sp. PMI_390]